MAHNLNYNERRGTHSLYSLKDVPWHGLGQIVAESVTATEALTLANLDYEVALAPMFASFIPDNTVDITPGPEGSFLVKYIDEGVKPVEPKSILIPSKGARVPDIYCSYRTDNYDIFGPVGSRYEIVQNDQALDFIYAVIKEHNDTTKDDIVIQTAGALNKGERIFVTAKLPSTAIRVNGLDDEYDRYIVFTSSHDGSTPVQAMFTNIRVVCNNTLNAALHSNTNMYSFRHTKNVKMYMKEGADMMAKVLGYNRELQEMLSRSIDIKMNEADMYKFVGNVLLSNNEQNKHFMDCALNRIDINPEIISTRKLNVINNVILNIREGVGQDIARGTLYNIYNGITTYINNGVEYNSGLDKFNSVMTTKGVGYKLNTMATNELIRLIAS